MKKTLLLIAFALLLYIKPLDAKPSFGGGISFGVFFSSLSPYGEWIQLDADLYGWRPYGIHRNWRPYSIGRWEWTRDGWYWDSAEPFGWATYHYGRWYYDDYYGWIWVPDYEWGPSWVEWRYDDDYIGWAPLPPYASFSINFGIHFSINWHSGYNYWSFVPYRRFCGYRVDHYILDYRRSRRIFDNTKYRSNYYSDRGRIINGGVDREQIERRSGYRIAERDIRNVDNYGDYERSRNSSGGREIYSYRPSEREVEKFRDNQNFEFRKNDRETNLQRDKVITPRERITNGNRADESKREAMTERSRPEFNQPTDRGRDDVFGRDRFNSERNQSRPEERPRINDQQNKNERNYQRVQPERRIEPRSERRVDTDRSRSSSGERARVEKSGSNQNRQPASRESKSVERKRR